MNVTSKMKFLGFGSQVDSTNAVITLASANIGLAGVDKMFKNVDSWLHLGLSLAQIGVAVVTIYFIWCKARKVVLCTKTKGKPRRKQ